MNKDFFKTTKILDGGMGQELLARGMKPKGTLWSANALVDEKYHNLILDIHNDFIKSGAPDFIKSLWISSIKLWYFSSTKALALHKVPLGFIPLANNSWPIPPSKIFVVLKKSLFISSSLF